MQALLSTLSRKASVTGRKNLLVVAELCLRFIIPLGEWFQRHCTPVWLNGAREAKVCSGALQGAFAPLVSYRNNFSSTKDWNSRLQWSVKGRPQSHQICFRQNIRAKCMHTHAHTKLSSFLNVVASTCIFRGQSTPFTLTNYTLVHQTWQGLKNLPVTYF